VAQRHANHIGGGRACAGIPPAVDFTVTLGNARFRITVVDDGEAPPTGENAEVK
jgi:hypothetical protein